MKPLQFPQSLRDQPSPEFRDEPFVVIAEFWESHGSGMAVEIWQFSAALRQDTPQPLGITTRPSQS